MSFGRLHMPGFKPWAGYYFFHVSASDFFFHVPACAFSAFRFPALRKIPPLIFSCSHDTSRYQIYNVTFTQDFPSDLPGPGLITSVFTKANSGAIIRNNDFYGTSASLARIKSPLSLIANNSLGHSCRQNFEVWREGEDRLVKEGGGGSRGGEEERGG